jgi:hypothetical protein
MIYRLVPTGWMIDLAYENRIEVGVLLCVSDGFEDTIYQKDRQLDESLRCAGCCNTFCLSFPFFKHLHLIG